MLLEIEKLWATWLILKCLVTCNVYYVKSCITLRALAVTPVSISTIPLLADTPAAYTQTPDETPYANTAQT